MVRARLGLAGVALCLSAPAAWGEPLPPALTGGEPAMVREVVDGDTLSLTDGRELRLASILAPRAAPPRSGQPARRDPELERLAAASRQELASLIGKQPVTVHVIGATPDRHGRWVAQLAGPTGEWVQAALVSRGLARVQPAADSGAGMEILLRLEATARDSRTGLWRHEAFRVRAPHEAGRWIETFQLVEGTAVPLEGRPAGRIALESQEPRLVLNLSARTRSELRAAGLNASTLAGLPLRVRGWLRWQNGPLIDVTHAAQIEILVAR